MKTFTISFQTLLSATAFTFNPTVTPDGVKYHVSAVSAGDKTFNFTMEQKNLEWRIVNAPRVPDWILQLESSLSEAISAYLASFKQDPGL